MNDWAENQALRLAADMGRVYAQREVERQSLSKVTQASMELVRALSTEDASSSLCRWCVELFGFRRAAVYLLKGGRIARQSQHPVEAGFRLHGVAASDLEALGGHANEVAAAPWLGLAGGRLSVIPLSGRQRVLGFLAAEGALPQFEPANPQGDLLALLAGYAGIVLENLLYEERRSESLRLRLPGAKSASAPPLGLFGESPAMREVLALVRKLARVDSPVLLCGETGTGKSLVARALHDSGPRAAKPFVTLNCAAIPEALVESELFGHEVGAFSGAQKLHHGKVEQAEGGTLFLDEVGALPLAVQTKLLTFLEERRFMRIGGERELKANVRLLSATNADLEAAVRERAFRSDLLYRINVFVLELPPLRARGEDVTSLAQVLAEEVSRRYDLPAPCLSQQVQARLLAYSWPGNVRELRNVMEKAVILGDGEPSLDMLPTPDLGAPGERLLGAADEAERGSGRPLPRPESVYQQEQTFSAAKAQMIARWELAFLRGLLESTGGNVSKAARLAKMDKKNLQRKVQHYEIDLEQLRGRS